MKSALLLLAAFPVLCAASGKIGGEVDGIDKGVQGALAIRGWACQGESDQAIEVRAAFGKPASQGVALLAARADLPARGSASARCARGASPHGFRIRLSPRDAIRFAGEKVYVYAMGPAKEGVEAEELPGSGSYSIPDVAYEVVDCSGWNGVVDRNIRLRPAHCLISKQVVFAGPDLSLDCDGGTIDGKGVQAAPGGRGQGIGAESGQGACVESQRSGSQSLFADADASGAVVKNCKVSNFKFGIMFQRRMWTKPSPGAGGCVALGEFSLGDPQSMGPADLDRALGGRDRRYGFAAADVTLRNVEVSHSASDGVFVNEYARGWLLEEVDSHDNGNGIYLERESQGTRVVNSIVARNRNVGVAIDSSAKNLLERNSIEGNGAIGIALYKNCGEGGGVTRYQHSDGNSIVGNIVRGQGGAGPKDMTLTQAELNAEAGNGGDRGWGVGIWIASRQGLDGGFMRRAHAGAPAPCSDEGREIGGRIYFPDYASGNLVEGNTIAGNSLAQVVVEDDGNSIVGNDLGGAGARSFAGIVVGSVYRQDDAKRGPVRNVKVRGNRLQGSGADKPVVYLGGSKPGE